MATIGNFQALGGSFIHVYSTAQSNFKRCREMKKESFAAQACGFQLGHGRDMLAIASSSSEP